MNYVFPGIFHALLSIAFYSSKCSLVYDNFSNFLYPFLVENSSSKILHGNLIDKMRKWNDLGQLVLHSWGESIYSDPSLLLSSWSYI